MERYLDTAPCGYFRFDNTGKILEVNQSFCTLLGWDSKDELRNSNLSSIFPVATRIFYQTHFFPLLKMNGMAEEIFMTLINKNGVELPVLINARTEKVEGRVEYAAIVIAVHTRNKFEAELIRAKKEAEKAMQENQGLVSVKEELLQRTRDLDHQIHLVNKQNREMAQFNRVVTHELQEPLRKLFFTISILKQEQKVEDKTQLEKLIRSAERLKDVLSGLQQYVWLQENRKSTTSINLNTLVLLIRKRLEKEYGENSLELSVSDLPVIKGDARQIELMFYEILKNAIIYRKVGEKAEVSVVGTELQQNSFRELRDQYQYEGILKVEIQDKGIGFSPDYSDHIFDLFSKLHSGEGRGLGLALSRMVAENHGGQISANSIPGKGTTITIVFRLLTDHP